MRRHHAPSSCPRCCALQGTPIQNNLEELWSLVDFALQGALLGTRRVFNKGAWR